MKQSRKYNDCAANVIARAANHNRLQTHKILAVMGMYTFLIQSILSYWIF